MCFFVSVLRSVGFQLIADATLHESHGLFLQALDYTTLKDLAEFLTE